MSVIVVVNGVNVGVSVCTEIIQRLLVVVSVNSDKISACPDFNADQHEVDVLQMV